MSYTKFAGRVGGMPSTSSFPNLRKVSEPGMDFSGSGKSTTSSYGSTSTNYSNVKPPLVNQNSSNSNTEIVDMTKSVVSNGPANSSPSNTSVNYSGTPTNQRMGALGTYSATAYGSAPSFAKTGAVQAVAGPNAMEQPNMLDNPNARNVTDAATNKGNLYQTTAPGGAVTKIDILGSAGETLDKVMEKVACYSTHPEEDVFRRILRRKGEQALVNGDKDTAVKMAAAMNALDFLPGFVNKEIGKVAHEDIKKAEAQDKKAGLFGVFSDPNEPSKGTNWSTYVPGGIGIATALALGFSPKLRNKASRGIGNLWNKMYRPEYTVPVSENFRLSDIGSKLRSIGRREIVAGAREKASQAREAYQKAVADADRLHLPRPDLPSAATRPADLLAKTPKWALTQAGLKKVILSNPFLSDVAMATGTGLGATALASALPQIDEPTGKVGQIYNNFVKNPLTTGLSAGLVAPMLITHRLGLNQAVKQPNVQTYQNMASGVGGALGLAKVLAPFDQAQEFFGRRNRTVNDHPVLGTALGGLAGAGLGLGTAYMANKYGDLDYGIDDYAKYTTAGAALGAGAGFAANNLLRNYNKDVDYNLW